MGRLYVQVLTHCLPLHRGVRVNRLLTEFRTDWKLAGRAPRTAQDDRAHLIGLLANGDPTAADAKAWAASTRVEQVARMRARAIRGLRPLGRGRGHRGMEWWQRVPLPNVDESPQPSHRGRLPRRDEPSPYGAGQSTARRAVVERHAEVRGRSHLHRAPGPRPK